jgi:hypothetical protein
MLGGMLGSLVVCHSNSADWTILHFGRNKWREIKGKNIHMDENEEK